MTKWNQHKQTWELSDYEQFQVKWLGKNVDDFGKDYVIDHGYWNVTEIVGRKDLDPTLMFVLHNQHGMTETVNVTELVITLEAGHRKHCLASAMISFIENWRDAEDINTFDFVTTMQGQPGYGPVPLDGAREYLNDGIAECICLTSKGMI